MALTDFTGRAIEIVRQAISEDNAGNYESAFRLYLKAMDWFEKAVEYERNPKAKASIKSKMMEYLKRAEELKEYTQKNQGKKQPVVAGGGESKNGNQKSGEDKETEEEAAFGGAVVVEKPNVKWDDVAGLETAKSLLQEAVILPIKFPQLFTGKRKPWRGILLYGPPGTGKSYLAKAVATEVDSTFLSVSSSDLVSKYLGESEKQIKGLFEYARKHRPSVIFIDEIDSLASSRSAGENDATRRIKTEILVQMQGVGSNNDNILVLGATNTPWEIDPAVRRRFEKRIYIPLPAAHARAHMFKLNVGNTPNSLNEADYKMMGERTEGFSGSDIATLTRDALMEPLRTCQMATHFREIPNPEGGPNLFTPCSPGAPGARAMTLMELESEQLFPPIVSMSDFEKCLLNARPTVAPEDLVRQEEWTEQFGQEG